MKLCLEWFGHVASAPSDDVITAWSVNRVPDVQLCRSMGSSCGREDSCSLIRKIGRMEGAERWVEEGLRIEALVLGKRLEDIDEDMMDWIDEYLMVELLGWWKRHNEL